MGENQRGVSGDAEEPRPHGLHDFYGREQELAWLRGLWDACTERDPASGRFVGGPRAAFVVAESGIGKSRLVQALYQQLTVDPAWDPPEVNYWPDAFHDQGVQLRVVPQMQGHVPKGPPRFAWLGTRWTATEVRNVSDRRSNLPELRHSIMVHAEVLRDHGSLWQDATGRIGEAIRKQALGETISQIADAAVPFGGVLSKIVAGAARLAKDRLSGPRSVEDLQDAANKTLVDEVCECLHALVDGAGGLPTVLWLDDAQWIDGETLAFVRRIWLTAEKRRWPLLLVLTHWEREWRELARSGDSDTLQAFEGVPGVEVRVLEPAPPSPLEQYLSARLPGLTAPQRALMLDKAAGNFLTMVENVGQLLRVPPNFVDRDPTAALSPAGERKVHEWESDRQKRVEQRFSELAPELQELLGWGSHLGMSFLREVIEEFAERIAGQSGAGAMLAEAVDPLVILGEPSAHLREFRDKAFHHVAARHFRDYGEEHADALQEILKSHLIEWVDNAFDEEGNAIWPDAEGGIEPPPRSVTALPSEEARDLLGMAVVQLPLAESPDWSDPSHQAALRARVLSAFNDAADRLWDRVRIDATALGTVAWVELPEAVVAISARDSLRRLWWDAGAYEASDPLVEDLAARVRACPEHRERLVDYLMALGVIARERGDCERALQAWSEAGQVARDLVARDNTPERQALLLDPLCYLGDLALVEYWHDIARAAFAEHLNIARRLADTSGTPKDLLRLAQAYEVIGDLEVACDKVVEADTAYAEFEAIARRVAAEVDTRDSRFGELKVFAGHALAMSLMKRSECQDDQEASRSLIREAIVMFRARAEDSQLPDDRWDLAKALIQLGWAEFDWDEDNARWRAAFEESIQIARDLVDTRGASNDLICLNQGLRQFGSWLTFPVSWKPRQEDYDRAHSVLAEAVEVSRGLVAHAETGRGSWRESHAETLLECIALNQESADAAACLPLSQELFEFNLRRFTAEITRIGGAMIRVNNLTLTDLNRLLWCHLELGQVAEACEVVEKALSWATHLEAAFDDPAIDNAEQQLDATTLERCAEAWSLAARCAEEMEQDAARAAQCHDRASSLRARIAAMKAGAGAGRGAGDDGGVS